MRKYIYFALFLNICLNNENLWGISEENDVAILTKENFNDFIKKHPLVMTMFYAPWCNHCKSFAPIYSAMAKVLKEKDIPVAKIDATIEADLASNYGVKGYPTLILFMEGKAIIYKGERTQKALYNFIIKCQAISIPQIKLESELEQYAAKNISAVYFIPEITDEILKLLKFLQATYEDIPFAYSDNKALKQNYDESPYVLVLFRQFDDGEKIMVTKTIPEEEKIKKFINIMKFPIVMPFNELSADRIFSNKKPTMVFFSDKLDSDYFEIFKNMANANPTAMLYAYSKISDGYGVKFAEMLGVNKETDPAVRIIDFKNNSFNKYKIENISSIGLKKALQDYKEGKLKPFYKSEPLPISNNGPVKVIVGDNFDEIILDNNKYVLLEAYAPWCEKCKRLEPIYKQLAEALKDEEDIIIAKMDATLNEHPSLKIQSFPTIYFYKPGLKSNPEKYEGTRDLESFKTYLENKIGRKFATNEMDNQEL